MEVGPIHGDRGVRRGRVITLEQPSKEENRCFVVGDLDHPHESPLDYRLISIYELFTGDNHRNLLTEGSRVHKRSRSPVQTRTDSTLWE